MAPLSYLLYVYALFCYFNLPFPPPSPSSVTLIFQAKIFRAKKGEKLALSGHKINQILLPSLSTRPRRSVSSLLLLLLSLCPSSISLPTLRQTAVGGEEERGEGGFPPLYSSILELPFFPSSSGYHTGRQNFDQIRPRCESQVGDCRMRREDLGGGGYRCGPTHRAIGTNFLCWCLPS